jgi:hypothetical protein
MEMSCEHCGKVMDMALETWEHVKIKENHFIFLFLEDYIYRILLYPRRLVIQVTCGKLKTINVYQPTICLF